MDGGGSDDGSGSGTLGSDLEPEAHPAPAGFDAVYLDEATLPGWRQRERRSQLAAHPDAPARGQPRRGIGGGRRRRRREHGEAERPTPPRDRALGGQHVTWSRSPGQLQGQLEGSPLGHRDLDTIEVGGQRGSLQTANRGGGSQPAQVEDRQGTGPGEAEEDGEAESGPRHEKGTDEAELRCRRERGGASVVACLGGGFHGAVVRGVYVPAISRGCGG